MSQITVAPGRCWSYSHYVGRRATVGAGFSQPVGIALGQDGVVYIANRGNPRVSKATVDQEFITEFGRRGEDEGQFIYLTDIAADKDENIYAADEWLNRIAVFSKDGEYLKTWGEAGEEDGQLTGPSGLAFDADDNLWVVNSHNSRIQKFSKDGQFLGGFGRKGNAEGELDMPWGITIDGQGDIYIADWNNHRIQKFTSGGTHLRTFGSGKPTGVSTDGGTPYVNVTEARVRENPNNLNHPTGVAVDPQGDVYVVDWMNERVIIFDPEAKPIATLRGDAQGLSKWAELAINANPDMAVARRRVKNPEVQEYFRMPVACAYDQENNRLIVCDTMRGRLQIYQKDLNYLEPQLNL